MKSYTNDELIEIQTKAFEEAIDDKEENEPIDLMEINLRILGIIERKEISKSI